MCGIFGAYSSTNTIPDSIGIQALRTLAHRGPDDQGIWRDSSGSVCLGHRRLSLVDIENGKQPIFNEDQSIAAVINGEFYGYQEVNHKLKQLGHCFSTDTDSEVAIHLYEQYGLDFLDHLVGEFALLIWDQNLRRLIVARDRFGVKPLVYTQLDSSLILFASESKALLPFQHNPDWDYESVFWSSSLQYLPEETTLFKDINLVPPGHFLIVDANGIRSQKYWDLDYPTRINSHSEKEKREAIFTTRDILKQCVLQRMQTQAPICFHLSGGLDSSATLGIASKETGTRQTAFTIGFESELYDERQIAMETAKFCNADLNLLVFSNRELIDSIIPAAMASEGLAINGHLSAKFILNKKIREMGFKVALTGEGADETFLGYAHLKMDWWKSQAIDFQKKDFHKNNLSSVGMMLPHGDSLCLNQLSNLLGYIPYFLRAKASLGFRVRSLIHKELQDEWSKRDAYLEFADRALSRRQLQGRTPIHQSAWMWTKSALPSYILMTLGDGTEMASSIEGRLPFLDHRLFEFVRRQPVESLFHGDQEKLLLRKAVEPYVTKSVFKRPKHPFVAPPCLLGGSTKSQGYLHDQLESELFRAQPFFDKSKVRRIVDRAPKMDHLERQVWDPVFMILITSLGIQQLITDSSKRS